MVLVVDSRGLGFPFWAWKSSPDRGMGFEFGVLKVHNLLPCIRDTKGTVIVAGTGI